MSFCTQYYWSNLHCSFYLIWKCQNDIWRTIFMKCFGLFPPVALWLLLSPPGLTLPQCWPWTQRQHIPELMSCLHRQGPQAHFHSCSFKVETYEYAAMWFPNNCFLLCWHQRPTAHFVTCQRTQTQVPLCNGINWIMEGISRLLGDFSATCDFCLSRSYSPFFCVGKDSTPGLTGQSG